jgi:hypothetical protein
VKVAHFTFWCCGPVSVWRYKNDNLYATIKLHKPNMSIREIINWGNRPADELAKHLTRTMHIHLNLLYTYNMQNTKKLITDKKLQKLTYKREYVI